MSAQKSGKAKRNPGRVNRDKFRSYKNKLRQRAKHAARYPNDKDSLARAKRWVEPPKAS